MNSPPGPLIIVGNPDRVHVGAHLVDAAKELGVIATIVDTREAFSSSWLRRNWNWRFRGRRPDRLEPISDQVVELCRRTRARRLLTTGIAPVSAGALEAIRALGVELLNFLTDDPWNPAHRAPWFLDALPRYDRVFTPRRANMADLTRAGARDVRYLPFAYAPAVHFPEAPVEDERSSFEADVVFAGGADQDRKGLIEFLSDAGLSVALYGGYWDRIRRLRRLWHGYADPTTLRKAVGTAKVTLCLVRQANRDGHSMRSFEVPAMKGCPLVEDTAEHREIFGPEGEAALYFTGLRDLADKARRLVATKETRAALIEGAYRRMSSGPNTYRDRLQAMLGLEARIPSVQS